MRLTGSGPVTVTITATADSAEKAIAMWADGGNSVNYIAGSSSADGPGDSITLNANGVNDPARLARLIEPELKKLARLAR